MFERLKKILEERRHRQSLRFWRAHSGAVQDMPLSDLRGLRKKANQARRLIDRINHVAVSRLTLPVIGSNAIRKPPRTEWAYRPQAWAGPVYPSGLAAVASKQKIGDEVTIFHDCTQSELAFRQVRNTNEEDFAPFGLRMDVFNFDGSFLSLAVEMPPAALEGLKRSHILRLDMRIESERPQEMFARLNIRHGPNTEQIVRELDMGGQNFYVEFDLYYTQFNEDRGDSMWVDLIFEGPSMNQVTIRDVTMIRRPRASI
ncbi:DUF6478 family protein [Neptunicoccus cionae]|uniref:DUF6478 family protein n=1 Tax=Neptunicoccus cionae TaxID=2035344 RepID=UPI0015E07DBF|nr:DUF6478 family protein [Amylibacter cionae]